MTVLKYWDGSEWLPAVVGRQGPQGEPGIVVNDTGVPPTETDVLWLDEAAVAATPSTVAVTAPIVNTGTSTNANIGLDPSVYGNRNYDGVLSAPICASRSFMGANGTNGLRNKTFQRVYQMTNDAKTIRLVYANWYLSDTNTESNSNLGAIDVKAYVIFDYDGNTSGVSVPVLFNKSSSISIPGGAVAVSDPIQVSFTTTTGSYIVVRTYTGSTNSGIAVPYMFADSPLANTTPQFLRNGWTEGFVSGDVSNLIDSFSSATTTTAGYGPHAIIGWSSNNKSNTTLLTGDSIMSGHYSTSDPFSFGNYATAANGIPAVRVSRGGELVFQAIKWSNMKKRSQLFTNCKYAICNYGINDIKSDYSTSAIKTNLIAYWNILSSYGMHVYQTTLTPYTSSSNGGINQSIPNGFWENRRQEINTWLRAPASAGAGNSAIYDAGGVLNGVFDTGSAVEVNADNTFIIISSTDGTITNGSGGYFYTDPSTYVTGTLTNVTTNSVPFTQNGIATTFEDSSKAWSTNSWTGYRAIFTSGAAIGASVGIGSNTGFTFDAGNDLPTYPSIGDTYTIYKTYYGDGTHPTALGNLAMAAKIDTTKLVPR